MAYTIVTGAGVATVQALTTGAGYVMPQSTPSDQTGAPYTLSYGQPVQVVGGFLGGGQMLSAYSQSVVFAADQSSVDTGNALVAVQAVMAKLNLVIARLDALILAISDGFSLTTDYSAVSADFS